MIMIVVNIFSFNVKIKCYNHVKWFELTLEIIDIIAYLM